MDLALSRGVPKADVLVIMGCTNDIYVGLPISGCLAQWDRLAATTSDHILVSAIAPFNGHGAEVLAYNAALQAHAQLMGWAFADPYAGAREPDGTYQPGSASDLTVDGVHPSIRTQEAAGAILARAIVNLIHPSLKSARRAL